MLEALIVQFPKAKFILGGDFNARIGSGQEAQSIGLNDLIVEQTLVKRISNDRCINKPGLKLLELLSSFDLCVLHGSRYDASGGAFTYISAQRASTIDYIAISADLFSRVLLFDILETSLSDHNPLWLSISCHKDLFLPPNLNANDTTGHRKPKWSDHLQRLVEQTLKSEEGLSFAKAILNPGCDLIGLYENLAKSLRSLFMHKKPSKPTSPMDHAWFDRECKTCKKKLLKCIRTARKFKDEASLTQLRRVKTQYKELLKLKKLEYSNRYWNKLQETVIRKNDTLFWDLISLGTKNPSLCTGTSISAGAWYDYYTKIFGNSRSNGTTQIFPEPSVIWPPVSEDEIKSLIMSLTLGKSPGEDLVPSKCYKIFSVFSRLFTQINNTGKLPQGWTTSIIVPIHKKGDRNDPRNYRPISLIPIASKLYGKFLKTKLEEWVEDNHVLHSCQLGFKKGHSTIEHCQTLYYLASSAMKGPTRALYVAYVDLASAFDSLDRGRLWQKLLNLGVETRLVYLIRQLHLNITIRVKVGSSGSLTNEIPVQKGVKQGCVLAPLLFNLYINDLATKLEGSEFTPPSVGQTKVSILLYADDMVLTSLTRVGLKRLLDKLGLCCKEDGLNINYEKTKVMVFRKRPKKPSWNILGTPIEQCSTNKYLGITFSETLSWKAHVTTL